jgi:hypothetical protein
MGPDEKRLDPAVERPPTSEAARIASKIQDS